jgi:hypothetical protein
MSAALNIELGILKDGVVMLASDAPFPHVVKRVEFYRDQKLFMLVYRTDHEETELMHYEVPANMTAPIEQSPSVLIYALYPDNPPLGYKVPLVKVGAIY